MTKLNQYILFVFVTLEVLLYNRFFAVQAAVSIIEYLFILFVLARDFKKGTLYFIAFSLLAMGKWSYVITEEIPFNFWGLRFFNFSVNIFLSLFIFLRLILKYKKNIDFDFVNRNRLIFIYLVFTFVIGLFSTLFGINYHDDFISDVFVSIPIITSFYLISIYSHKELQNLAVLCIKLTTYSMLLSYLFNIEFEYSEGEYFVLMNSFAFIVPFSIFFFRKYLKKEEYIIQVCVIAFLFITGKIFLSGKLMIIIVLLILWLIYINRKSTIAIAVATSLFLITPVIIEGVTNYVNSNVVLQWKFKQIESGLSNYNNLMLTEGSLGNLFAEGYLIQDHFKQNKRYFVMGKGLGAGIPDKFQLLSVTAGAGGYKIEDLNRNNYHIMHLSLLDLALKGGYLWGALFIFFVCRFFFMGNIFSFVTFILLFMVYYTSKEMILITVLFYRLSIFNNSTRKLI
ncbi:hypothetical protein ACMDB5_01705 [Flavobacterium sp. W1B]|uniref:hypothetical protein n=1 Tax=Flavobacterium sp. W1B TaxID=3394146 RepID=UPI0039BCCE95